MNQAPRWVVKFKKSGSNSDFVDMSDSVLSLSFIDSEAKADKLTLVMDNYEAVIYDNPLVAHGNIIQFSFGYTDGVMSPTYECVIRKVSGGDQVTVEANAKSVLMDTKKVRKAYRNKTRSEVVREIAERYGYSGPTAIIEDTSEVFGQITQHNITDAMMLRKLADLQGCSFWVSFDGLHWHTRDLQQAPILELVYFTDKDKGSIYTYNIENDITRMPGRIKTKSRDPLEKVTIEGKADNDTDGNRSILQPEKALTEFRLDIDEETLAVTQKDVPLGGIPQDESMPSSEQTPGAVQTEATKKFRLTTLSAVKMTLNCIGNPILLAKTVVKVSGLGTRISGKYYVKEVTHELTSGYDMTVKVATDGFRKSTPKKCTMDTSVYAFLDDAESAAKSIPHAELQKSVTTVTKSIREAVSSNNPVNVRNAMNKTFAVVHALKRFQKMGLSTNVPALTAEKSLTQSYALLSPCLDPDNAAQGRPNDKDVADPNELDQRLYIDEETLEVRTNFTSAYDGRGYFDGEITQTRAK
jgi:phage protein D